MPLIAVVGADAEEPGADAQQRDRAVAHDVVPHVEDLARAAEAGEEVDPGLQDLRRAVLDQLHEVDLALLDHEEALREEPGRDERRQSGEAEQGPRVDRRLCIGDLRGQVLQGQEGQEAPQDDEAAPEDLHERHGGLGLRHEPVEGRRRSVPRSWRRGRPRPRSLRPGRRRCP